MQDFIGDAGKLHGETPRRPHGWAEPLSKGGLRGGGLGADVEVTHDELPELVVLDQPGGGWKEVEDEVFLSQV